MNSATQQWVLQPPLPHLPLTRSLRYLVEKLNGKIGDYIGIAPKEICRDATHLEVFFQDVLDKGGEGIILRDPTSPYEVGRSPGYLKHKASFLPRIFASSS